MKEKILGIDPGVAAGGAVIVERGSNDIVAVERLYSNITDELKSNTPGDTNFTVTVRRAEIITNKIIQFVLQEKPDLITIESFVDFGSHAKQTNKAGGAFFAKDKWKVPLVIGYASAKLQPLKIPTIYVGANILRQYQDEISMLEDNRKKKGKGKKKDEPIPDLIVKNDGLLTNDHLVKAWCHADWAVRNWDEIQEELEV